MELKSVFEQIQAAEAAGNLSPEEKKRLEEQAAEKGLQALFKVCILTSRHEYLFHLTGSASGHKTRDRVYPPRSMRSRTRGPYHTTIQGAVTSRGATDPRRGLYGG